MGNCIPRKSRSLSFDNEEKPKTETETETETKPGNPPEPQVTSTENSEEKVEKNSENKREEKPNDLHYATIDFGFTNSIKVSKQEERTPYATIVTETEDNDGYDYVLIK